MNKKSANKEEKSKYWLDQPANVKKIIHGFYWLCGLVILADIIFSLVWHKHAIFKEDVSLHSYETFARILWDIWISCLRGFGLRFEIDEELEWKKRSRMREEDYWDK